MKIRFFIIKLYFQLIFSFINVHCDFYESWFKVVTRFNFNGRCNKLISHNSYSYCVREITFKSQEVAPSHPSNPSVCNALCCTDTVTPHSSYSKNELHSATALRGQSKMVGKKCVCDTGSDCLPLLVFHWLSMKHPYLN